MNLGDKIESALQSVGVDKALAEKWLGPECGCDYRKERLNLLGQWAAKTLSGSFKKAKEYLLLVLEEEQPCN